MAIRSTKRLTRFITKYQSLWSLGGNGVTALSGLLLFVITSRRLSAIDFGLWTIFQVAAGLMDMARTGLLLPGYLQISAGQSKKNKKTLFSAVQMIVIAVTLAQVAVCVGLFQIENRSSTWSTIFQYYPYLAVSSAAFTLSEWWLQSNSRFQYILILRVFNRTGTLVCALFLATNLPSLVYVQSAVNVLTAVLSIVIWRIPVPVMPSESHRPHVKKLLSFGKYATATQVASNLLRSSDTFIINLKLGAYATGIFSVAAKFLEFVELPIRSLGSVLYNKVSALINAEKYDDVKALLRHHFIKSTLLVLPVSAFLIVAAPILIQTLSGDRYLSAVPILRIMAIYCLLIPADRCLGILLEAMRRPDLNLIKVLVMLALNVVGDFFALTMSDSITAVAASSILTFLAGVGVGYWLITRRAFPKLNPTLHPV